MFVVYRVLICLICFLVSSPVLAEPPAKKFGRLSSGEAYRIDNKGFRLVDQLAELEVTNDDLKRQVVALEDELAEKRQVINSLTGGDLSKTRGTIKEQNLVNAKPEPTLPGGNYLTSQLPPAKTAKNSIIEKQVDCETQISPLESTIASLTKELAMKQQQVAQLGQTSNIIAKQKRSETESISKQLSAKTKQIAALQAELRKHETNSDRLVTKNEEITALQQELKLAATANRNLEEKIIRQDKRLALAEQNLAQARGRLKSNQTELAKVKERPTTIKKASSKAIDSTKAVFQTKLANIQKLIGTRKQILDKLKSRNASISVKIQPLVTNKGMSLDRLRSKANGLDDLRQAPIVRKGLAQIENILREDIAVLNRLSKLT